MVEHVHAPIHANMTQNVTRNPAAGMNTARMRERINRDQTMGGRRPGSSVRTGTCSAGTREMVAWVMPCMSRPMPSMINDCPCMPPVMPHAVLHEQPSSGQQPWSQVPGSSPDMDMSSCPATISQSTIMGVASMENGVARAGTAGTDRASMTMTRPVSCSNLFPIFIYRNFPSFTVRTGPGRKSSAFRLNPVGTSRLTGSHLIMCVAPARCDGHCSLYTT